MKMKKLMALVLALTLVLALAACGQTSTPAEGGDTTVPAEGEQTLIVYTARSERGLTHLSRLQLLVAKNLKFLYLCPASQIVLFRQQSYQCSFAKNYQLYQNIGIVCLPYICIMSSKGNIFYLHK